MYFNCNGIAVTLVILLFSGWAKSTFAQQQSDIGEIQSELIAQPNKCVAINQGRACFAKVNVSWTLDRPANIWLVDSLKSRPLFCWQNVLSGRYLYNMEADKDVQLRLVVVEKAAKQALSDMAIAQTTIKVSWLYKTNSRKRRWRLF